LFGLHRFIEQCLAGMLLGRAQAIGLEPQLQAGLSRVAQQQHHPGQQPGG
jgi:hypothetical protein